MFDKKRSDKKRSDEQRGVALMMTLWVMVLLTVLSVNFLLSTRQGTASTRNFKEESIAYAAALSAYEEVRGYLLSDKDPSVDFIDNDGLFRVDIERETVAGRRYIGDIEVNTTITDEESRLNINLLGEPQLRKLFEEAGIPEDSMQELIDSLADWKDPDNLHHFSGAEDDYYEALETPYKAKNRFLDVPEELLLIKGFRPQNAPGSNAGQEAGDAQEAGEAAGDGRTAAVKSMLPMLTTLARGLNVNTAPEELFKLLGFSSVDIDTIMRSRTKEAGGLKTIPPGAASAGFALTSSSIFRIHVKAVTAGGGGVSITSIVRRTAGPKGPLLETIYWREGIEGSRA